MCRADIPTCPLPIIVIYLRKLPICFKLTSLWTASITFFGDHGLYGSTSCCISHGPSQIVEGDFRPSTARRPLDPFSWTLKCTTTSRTRPRMQNFRGLRRRGWSGQIAILTHQSFCPFFVSLPRPEVAFLDTSQRSIRHYASFPPRECLLGLERLNLIFDPIYPPKT